MKWFEIKAAADAASAEVRVFGEIGWEVTAAEFVSALDELGPVDLHVRINSVGGSVIEGIHIYNRLLTHPRTVNVTIEGIAASMASVIAMAGETVSMLEASWLMIHNPAGAAFGEADDMRKNAEVLDKMRDTLVAAYARKTKLDADEIGAMMDEETWFSPAEAMEKGFVDAVVETDMDMAASLKGVDLSKFKHPPAAISRREIINQDLAEFKAASMNANTITVKAGEGVTGFQFVLLDEHKPNGEAGQSPANQNAASNAQEVVTMTDEEKAALEAAREEGRKAEVARRTSITAVFSGFPNHSAVRDECLADDKCTEAVAQAKLLKALEIDNNEQAQPHGAAIVVEDARSKFAVGVAAALAERCKVKGAQPDTRNEFRGLRLSEIAKQCAINAGVDVTGLRPLDYVGAAFSHSSSDFPSLLENVMGKVLTDAYEEWPATWSSWADTGSVSDFKQNSRVTLGSFNNLELVGEGGEFKERTFGEEKETITAQTKGNIFAITRQAIINDDLGGFTRIARMLGQAAARTVNADVYGVLTANGLMADGLALFVAGHNNLAGSGAAPTVATVSAGKAAMRKQKFASTDDAYLNFNPDTLLVPVALEDTALTLIQSSTDPAQANSRKPNIHQNTLTVVSDPVLDADSATAWYLVDSRNPIIEAVFLDGVQTPFLDSEEGFTVDGVRWKVRLDYGADSVEWRSAWKDPGA